MVDMLGITDMLPVILLELLAPLDMLLSPLVLLLPPLLVSMLGLMIQLSHIPVPIPLLSLMSMLRSQLSLMLMSRFQLSHTSTLSQLLLMLPPLLMPDMLPPLLTLDMPLPQLLLDMLESQLLLDMPVSQLSLDMGTLPPLDMLTKELTNQAQKTHPRKSWLQQMMLPHRTSHVSLCYVDFYCVCSCFTLIIYRSI